MDFLTLDKIFDLDNFNIVLDKKYFVRADGRGISLAKTATFEGLHLFCFISNAVFAWPLEKFEILEVVA